ncbi:MAG: cytidine/deoxycytidylate deaminase family protein [Bifidobacteriaceae bacterium]|jgi:dCMP deaminase|nr:cytidine/deoxycytidylate deaminase family protein [Bifidobacteriaceae bacterium]
MPDLSVPGAFDPLTNDQGGRRPSWDEYFVQLVPLVAGRATCDRGRSGAIVVRDHRIICSGYVGSPPGLEHCDQAGHLWRKVVEDDGSLRTHCVRTVHAEQNALAQAARYGLPLAGTTCYCTMEPCATCAMLLISAGVERVVALRRYHAAQQSRDLFAGAGVTLEVWHDEDEVYPGQTLPAGDGPPAGGGRE